MNRTTSELNLFQQLQETKKKNQNNCENHKRGKREKSHKLNFFFVDRKL